MCYLLCNFTRVTATGSCREARRCVTSLADVLWTSQYAEHSLSAAFDCCCPLPTAKRITKKRK